MSTVNIHEAKTQLSKPLEKASKGEVKVSAVAAPAAPKRLGFLAGEILVPEDFNSIGQARITALFRSQK